jgi:hypothetical protein
LFIVSTIISYNLLFLKMDDATIQWHLSVFLESRLIYTIQQLPTSIFATLYFQYTTASSIILNHINTIFKKRHQHNKQVLLAIVPNQAVCV